MEKVVAEGFAPARNLRSPGARKRGEEEGNDGGGAGLLIEPKMASINGHKHRQSREEFLPWLGRHFRLEEDDDDVIADVTLGWQVGPTWQSLGGKKRTGGTWAGGGLRWVYSSRAAVGLKLASVARAWAEERDGLRPFYLFFLIKPFLLFSKQQT